ncbi:hypothetical protein [Zunongwangia pacifica]|uniref:Trimeric autotransporter adhesin YadA-like head domain-containing protein n=1 Tax=Zunongwangia pacifica TaxID=2911062 RepID=A0A9X2CJ40_9FLAO|nr:hypothetical protein [Zunongwangia pacifica]MCL6217381.1 hypothetical protein [Zunongwangia pacifica]
MKKNYPLENNLALTVFSILFVYFLCINNISAQVGIGTTSPDPSAILHIQSTNKGVLLPKVDLQNLTDQYTVNNPTEGLLVYNERDDDGNNLRKGFYIWDNEKWDKVENQSDVDKIMEDIDERFKELEDGSGWALNGNSLSGDEFLGSTNEQPIVFKVNNVQQAQFGIKDRMAIGRNAAVSGERGFAIGYSAAVSTNDGYAYGRGATASGNDVYAYGYNSSASGSESYSFGREAASSGTRAYALGYQSRSSGTDSYSIGREAEASGTHSYAIGYQAKTSQSKVITLGGSDTRTGVGTGSPNSSAMLDVVSTNKGVLVPRIQLDKTDQQNPVSNPANGLLVFNTATQNDVTPGFYYWYNNKWNQMMSEDGIGDYFVYAEVYKSGAATHLNNAGNGNNSNAVWKEVDFGTDVVISNNVETTASSITVPVKGIYRVSYSVMMDNTSGGGGKDIYLKLQKNNNDVSGSLSIANVKNGDIKTVSKTKLLELNKNDTLKIIAGGPESDDSIIVMSDGTNFNIELVRRL